MGRKVSKTAMKFLSLACGAHGTHVNNLKDWVFELEDAGYIKVENYPFARITDSGRSALAAHVAAGGKTAK